MCSSSCQEKSHFIIHYECLKQYLLLLYLLSLCSAIYLQVLSRVQQYWVSMGASVESEKCTVKCLHFLSSRRGELVANFVAAEQLWLPPLWQWKDSGDPLPSEERRRVQDPQCWCPHCRPALYGVKSGVLTSRARISNLQSSWKWKLRMQREVCTTCRAAWLLASTQRVRQW